MAGQASLRRLPAPSDTQAAAARARQIVMDVERELGYEPTDREFEKRGYDIESRDPASGRLRFLEVKGRVSGAPAITVTRNEILYSLNKPDAYILAIVEFPGRGPPPSALPASPLPARARLRRNKRQLQFRRTTGARGGAELICASARRRTGNRTACLRAWFGAASMNLRLNID